MPNQRIKASMTCKKAQGLRLAKELVLRPHETSCKEPRTTKTVVDHAKRSLKHARAEGMMHVWPTKGITLHPLKPNMA